MHQFFIFGSKKKLIIILFGALLTNSCIDRINIVVPDSYSSQLVIDGLITDEPGPYTVRITRSTRVEKFLLLSQESVTMAKITISDNAGNSETLTEKEPGVYHTNASGIRGVVGREYSLRIETSDGKIYESLPDRMNPVGVIDSLYYEFESYLPLNDQTRHGFRFYIDANGIPEIDNLVRWRFTGVFEIDTEAKLRTVGKCAPAPPLCSGWIFGLVGNLPGLIKVGECTCCNCWVTKYEDKPKVSDNQFVSNGKARKIEVGYVPIDFFSFQKKYRVEVEQMSLSRAAFDYWRIIQAQKEGASSLFQPPTGKIRTNIVAKGGEGEVQGLFYASSIKKKQIYLSNADVKEQKVILRVPFWGCEEGIIAESCLLAFPNSSNVPPPDWK